MRLRSRNSHNAVRVLDELVVFDPAAYRASFGSDPTPDTTVLGDGGVADVPEPAAQVLLDLGVAEPAPEPETEPASDETESTPHKRAKRATE